MNFNACGRFASFFNHGIELLSVPVLCNEGKKCYYGHMRIPLSPLDEMRFLGILD